MSRIVVMEFVSLDGVMQAPGHAREDPAGFPHGGWSRPFFGEHGRFMPDVLGRADAVLFGRRTFEAFSAVWPRVSDASDVLAGRLNALPKYVVSDSLTEPAWQHTTVCRGGSLADRVARVREDVKGEVVVLGSATLVAGLLADDLVDGLELWLHPVVLGVGRRVFPTLATPFALQLVDAQATPAGLVRLRYDAAA